MSGPSHCRLLLLEQARQRRVNERARVPDRGVLIREAEAICSALSGEQQAAVEARGARGYAKLLEAFWEAVGTHPEDVARQAYRVAFERVTP